MRWPFLTIYCPVLILFRLATIPNNTFRRIQKNPPINSLKNGCSNQIFKQWGNGTFLRQCPYFLHSNSFKFSPPLYNCRSVKNTEVKRWVKNHMSLYNIKLRILPVSRIHVLICKLQMGGLKKKTRHSRKYAGIHVTRQFF